MLRFLADESCDFAVVRTLRTEGFDVLSVAEDGRAAWAGDYGLGSRPRRIGRATPDQA